MTPLEIAESILACNCWMVRGSRTGTLATAPPDIAPPSPTRCGGWRSGRGVTHRRS